MMKLYYYSAVLLVFLPGSLQQFQFPKETPEQVAMRTSSSSIPLNGRREPVIRARDPYFNFPNPNLVVRGSQMNRPEHNQPPRQQQQSQQPQQIQLQQQLQQQKQSQQPKQSEKINSEPNNLQPMVVVNNIKTPLNDDQPWIPNRREQICRAKLTSLLNLMCGNGYYQFEHRLTRQLRISVLARSCCRSSCSLGELKSMCPTNLAPRDAIDYERLANDGWPITLPKDSPFFSRYHHYPSPFGY